ncbi:hypothetical protein GGX14DRAFT_557395 [Mycena pura]|uniref:Uncharacterized protein n=1 Tax=Mycena pura TaxID=153505 RepID=A0AAD6YNE9_9AGAR|nr:hypothetical protein GGX14DRAFT_557395 [Mycena pura]
MVNATLALAPCSPCRTRHDHRLHKHPPCTTRALPRMRTHHAPSASPRLCCDTHGQLRTSHPSDARGVALRPVRLDNQFIFLHVRAPLKCPALRVHTHTVSCYNCSVHRRPSSGPVSSEGSRSMATCKHSCQHVMFRPRLCYCAGHGCAQEPLLLRHPCTCPHAGNSPEPRSPAPGPAQREPTSRTSSRRQAAAPEVQASVSGPLAHRLVWCGGARCRHCPPTPIFDDPATLRPCYLALMRHCLNCAHAPRPLRLAACTSMLPHHLRSPRCARLRRKIAHAAQHRTRSHHASRCSRATYHAPAVRASASLKKAPRPLPAACRTTAPRCLMQVCAS